MKTLAKNVLCGAYKYSGLLGAQEVLTSRRFLSILLFHRVTDEIPEDPITVSNRRFARICRMLRRHFHVVPLADIFRLRNSGEPFPRRTLAITFDDCYRDNLFAAQVLADYQLPACFFMPTAFVGTDHVFPWDRHLPRLANLSWDDVRAMAGMGHEIGSHTVTHPDMAQVPLEQARHELVESKRVLEEQLSRPVRWFAYPFGGQDNFHAERVPLVEEAGYDGCLSGFGGFVWADATDAIVPRVTVPEFHSVLNLELHLRGGLEWYYGLRRAARRMRLRAGGIRGETQSIGANLS